MGASVAYHLAQRGHTDVVLLEKGPFFGLGATGKCAGGIRYQFSTEINVRLSQLSLPMLDRFEAEIGQPIDRQYCGYLFLLTREQDVARFEHNVAMQHRLGVATEWLTAAEVRRRWPQLQLDDLLRATFNGRDGLADPNGVVMGYVQAARRLGVQCYTDSPVIGVAQTKERVTAVKTPHGRISCEVVVNAAGPWAGQVSQLLDAPLPITPIRRQMLTTTPLPEIPADFPFVIDFARSLYFHREGEGILTGMSNPNEPPGFDESVDEEWEFTHMEAAIERLPLLARAGRLAGWAGLYEVTPDAHPIIGPVPPVDGYYTVTGFSGHGFMHGPVAGLLLAEIILDGRTTTLDISSLDYGRFADGRLIQEYNVI
jgi:sarcosine oxidase, subunit beta